MNHHYMVWITWLIMLLIMVNDCINHGESCLNDASWCFVNHDQTSLSKKQGVCRMNEAAMLMSDVGINVIKMLLIPHCWQVTKHQREYIIPFKVEDGDSTVMQKLHGFVDTEGNIRHQGNNSRWTEHILEPQSERRRPMVNRCILS